MTPIGNYHYKVMPFGLKNAGSTYQRMMTRMFEPQLGKIIEVYIDDMVVVRHRDPRPIQALGPVPHRPWAQAQQKGPVILHPS